MDSRFLDPVLAVALASAMGASFGVYFHVMDSSDIRRKIYANLILSIFVGLSCWATLGKFKIWKFQGLDGHAWTVHHRRGFDLVQKPCSCSGWRVRPLPQKLRDMVFEVD